MRLPFVKTPCRDCPFKKDSLKGWLGKERISDILNSDSFVCHKNTKLQCAGHMIINSNNNIFVRMSGNIGIPLELKNKKAIFPTKDKCIKHHTKNNIIG